MLRLMTRSSCLPEASTYAPRQVPARSGRAGAVVVAGGGAVLATAAAAVTSADGASGAPVPEPGTAGGNAAGSVEAGACVVDACGSVNRGLLDAREAPGDAACNRPAWRTSVPNTSVATSTATKAKR